MSDKKTIEVAFNPAEPVIIALTGVVGVVASIWINKKGVAQYYVEYPDSNNAIHTDYFYAEDLSEISI